MAASAPNPAALLLARQFKAIQNDGEMMAAGISCGLVRDDVFEWEVMLIISDDCKFYGGASLARPGSATDVLTARRRLLPPPGSRSPRTTRTSRPRWSSCRTCFIPTVRSCALMPPLCPRPRIHVPADRTHRGRAVYQNGGVCISILHAPGHDPYNLQEPASERWSPVQTPATILLSVISMLTDPNPDSPRQHRGRPALARRPQRFQAPRPPLRPEEPR